MLEYAVYHLRGIGPTHLYKCLYMYILVQLFGWNQIEKRLYYAVNNWRCIEVRIKKKLINSCQQFSWARMWDCTATSYRKNRWRDKADIVRYRGGKLLVHACLLMGTTPKYEFMVQTLVSMSNLLSLCLLGHWLTAQQKNQGLKGLGVSKTCSSLKVP